ncbi:MAG: autotransporter-associated beta strand repeat-containing protein [Kiritimatiellae bacterium]|nr:autotransporter-associated beta strand repeat-containing protein [Kiritimatiellia bacterium]
MKLRIFCAMLAVGLSVWAEMHTIRWTGAVDGQSWANAGNYEGNALPSAGDVVLLPAKASVKLSQSDAASCALVSSLRAVMSGENTGVKLEIEVPEGQTLALGCALASTGESYQDTSYKNITITKTGAGRLELGSAAQFYVNNKVNYCVDYYVTWKVLAGTIRFPQTYPTDGNGHNGVLSLAEGATLVMGAREDGHSCGMVIRSLDGLGTVTNEHSVTQTLRLDGTQASGTSFGGKILGNIAYDSRGLVRLDGTESTMSGDFTIEYRKTNAYTKDSQGTTFVKKLGRAGEPSTTGVGSSIVFGNDGGVLRYTGTGETSDKKIRVKYAAAAENLAGLDACAVGGLMLTGNIVLENATKMHQFYLLGSNSLPCSISGAIKTDNDNTFHFLKCGSGEWDLRHNNDTTLFGAFTVREGTLGFDTIAEAGVVTALGKATCLQAPYSGDYDAAMDVPWAISLGGGAGTPRATLRYLGTTNCVATTRPIVVDGEGALVNDGTGRLAYAGVSVKDGSADSTLVLGGSAAVTNMAASVTDGANGKLSVVKEGAGTWRLGTNTTFSGSLNVKEGRLIVGVSPYAYYKWVIRATFTTAVDSSKYRVVGLQSFGLFDADGNDRAYGLIDDWTANSSGYYVGSPYSVSANAVFGSSERVPTLSPGMFSLTSYDGSSKSFTMGANSAFHNLFLHTNAVVYNVWSRSPNPASPPLIGDTTQWWAITMRPQPGAPITSWDYVNTPSVAANTYQMISNCTLEASVDGIHWTELAEVNNDILPTSGRWQADGSVYDAAFVTHKTGMAIPAYPQENLGTILSSASSVSVSSGAELIVENGAGAISKIVVDAVTGMGTVKGLALAEGGVIDIANPRADSEYAIAADFTNVTLPANYSFTLGGKAPGRAGVRLAADRKSIVVRRPGTLLIFR